MNFPGAINMPRSAADSLSIALGEAQVAEGRARRTQPVLGTVESRPPTLSRFATPVTRFIVGAAQEERDAARPPESLCSDCQRRIGGSTVCILAGRCQLASPST